MADKPRATVETADATVAPEEAAPAETLLELVLAAHAEGERGAPLRIDGVVVGTLLGFAPGGEPLVSHAAAGGQSLVARSMVALAPADVGREVAILFENGDPSRPVVMGRMHAPPSVAAVPTGAPTEAEADGERLVLSAEREIVLRCGKASITLTRAGKIILRGAYLLARSSGVNRIQGGSVQIN